MTSPSSRKGYDFNPLSYAVIGACQDVQRQLGLHCMEVDYQRALGIALSKRGLTWQREVDIPLTYDGVVVTWRRVDFIIQDGQNQLILETKATSLIKPEDVEQCLYFTCTRADTSYAFSSISVSNRCKRAASCTPPNSQTLKNNTSVG